MNKTEKDKFLRQRKKAQELLDFMAARYGITSEKFFEGVDIIKRFSFEQNSSALVQYCFRNGPVEDMHAHPNNQLSDADMKVLNTYCNDRIFTFLTMMKSNKIAKLAEIIEFGVLCAQDWDKPEYREDD